MRRADAVGDRIFLEGNNAAALGAVYGGATVAPGIRSRRRHRSPKPSASHCRRYRVDQETGRNRYAIVQAEDELASIGMVIGAAWNGARAFTCTAGPGISLMQEFIGLAYFAEIPAVIFDVQRGGPSTGMPTRTQQSDMLVCAYASHGDTKHVLLLPEDPHECFEFAALAFDLADRLQTPIFVMLDLDIGMNEWLCKPLAWDDSARYDRGKVLTAEELEAGREFGRYLDVDGDGITYRTLSRHAPEQGRLLHARHVAQRATPATARKAPTTSTTCSGCCASSRPPRAWCRRRSRRNAARPTDYRRHLLRLDRTRDERGAGRRSRPRTSTSTRCACAPSRSRTRWSTSCSDHDHVFVVEQNRDAPAAHPDHQRMRARSGALIPILHYDGTPITARFITARHQRALAGTARPDASRRGSANDLRRQAEVPPPRPAA